MGKELSPKNRTEAEEETPLHVGSFGARMALPVFRLRDLARMDAMGEAAWARDPGRRARKAISRSVERSRKDLERDLARAEKRRRRRTAPQAAADPLAGLPRHHSLKDRFGLSLGFGGQDSTMTGWHETTITGAGVLTPWVAGGRPPFQGPLIGVETRSGMPFHFDAWSAYRTGDVTSVNGIIAGMMGTGKSMLLKVLAVRHIQEGRRVLIEGDPKGEWKRLCHALGGAVVSVGPSSRLNILDVGDRPAVLDEAKWEIEALSLRTVAAKSVVSAIRPEKPLEMDENAILTAALSELGRRPEVPTVTRLVDLLTSSWPMDAQVRGMEAQQRRRAANSLVLVFDHLVHGELRGAFEDESSERIDPSAPMIVFDTGSADENNLVRKAVFTAAMNAGLERVCAARDGVFRLVIAEEGHELLKNPALVSGWDRRIRLSGDLRVANFLLIHELADLEKYARTEAARKVMEGIISLSEIKILFRQSPSSIPRLEGIMRDLSEEEKATLSSLPTGVALWRVGKVRTLVRALASRSLFDIIDTREGRQG
jgi:hypothetical protein